MIDRISLAECLEQYAPAAKVLDISAIDDTAFIRICDASQDHRSETHREVAEISVSLPSLIEALNLLAEDKEREHLRPLDNTGKQHETRLAGRRLTIAPVAPYSAVGALTDHLRYTERPEKADGERKETAP